MRLATTLALVLFAGNAIAEELRLPLFRGVWATELSHCGRDYADGLPEGAFITIGRGRIEFYESSCDIASVRKVTARRFRARLACSGEGETFERILLIEKHTPHRFTVIDGPGTGSTYRLCR